MKTPRLLLALLIGFSAACCPTSQAQSPPGLPEPGLFLYGPVVNSTNGQPVQPSNVQWQISGAGDSATLPGTCINVNGTTFFVLRVPFESRNAGGVTLTRTPGTFDLKSSATTYNRLATVDGSPATIQSSSRGQLGTFTFGAADRGVVERIVLGVNRAPISNLDTDGDGVPDYAELVAGTNPNDRNSFFKISPDLSVDINGGFVIKWASAAGRRYNVYRTTSMRQPFQLLATELPATAPLNSFTDSNARGNSTLFYRIEVCQ